MLRALRAELGLEAEVFAGHSLGEYTALVAAGVLDLGTAARLVRRRGALMQDAVPAGEGSMLAVIAKDLDLELLRSEIADFEVDAANHNSPSQIVVSGKAADVEQAAKRLTAAGRRCVPLNVSAPFHSRLMRSIEPAFAEELAGAALRAETAPRVASNFTGGFHPADGEAVRENLVRQISGTVRWVDNMRNVAERAGRVFEVGPGRPLSGFFREIGVTVTAILNVKGAEKALRSREDGE
jgi:malonyl CoA-acyl carrier protein transacylase